MADQRGLIQREMRLVELEDGWATAIEADQAALGWGIALMGVMTSVSVFGLIMTEHPLWVMLMLGAIVPLGMFPLLSFTHIRVRSHGLEISRLYSRSQHPRITEIREGGAKWMVVPRREPTRSLPFSEIRDMGCTDYSIWFDVSGERSEVLLEKTARADIQRLHDEIRSVWERYRQGLTDSAEDAEARRAQLSAVAARSSASEG